MYFFNLKTKAKMKSWKKTVLPHPFGKLNCALIFRNTLFLSSEPATIVFLNIIALLFVSPSKNKLLGC